MDDPTFAHSGRIGRNIVVYSDGTGQDGGVRVDQRLSNVYKMYRASRISPDSAIDPSLQVAFYDPGLGTDADAHGFGRIWRGVGKLLASIAGRGIGTNIADCYEFILNHWQPGDRIYLVGFSRGAYTVRCVAQVLSLCGVPTHEAGDPKTPFRRFRSSTRAAAERAVHQVYEHGAGHPIADFEAEREEQGRRFRTDYGSDVEGVPNASPYFIGVFDTVAALGAKGAKFAGILAVLSVAGLITLLLTSLVIGKIFHLPLLPTFAISALLSAGIAWHIERTSSRRHIDDFPSQGAPRRTHHVRWRAKDYDRGLSGRVGYARQASAIDEDRADFPRVSWGRNSVVRPAVQGEPRPLVQLWFAGNHSDIGGSYEEAESRLSDVALGWMVDEATSLPHPLLFDRSRLNIWPDHAGMQHSEVVATADRLASLWWLPARLRRGWSQAARKPQSSPMHPSVHARLAEASVVQPGGSSPYRPAALLQDGRFRHFWDGSDAVPPGAHELAAACRYEVADDERGWLTPSAFEADHQAVTAMIFPAPWTADERDDYAIALSQRALEHQATVRSRSWRHARRMEPDGRVEAGIALFDGGSEAAGMIARSIGQPLWIAPMGAGVAARRSFGEAPGEDPE